MKRTEKTDKILVKYKQYLKLEKSLSDNTVDAYLTDLDKLLAYLTLENINILDVRLENLEDFSAGLHDIGIHPRSQARILSGIRSFYRFLIMEDYLKADPTELLEFPQTGFKLPEVMTVEEIRGKSLHPHKGRIPDNRPTSCKHVRDAYRYPGSLPANCCVADATFAILSLFGFRRFTRQIAASS